MPALRSRRDFDRIQAQGRSRGGRLMAIRFISNGRDHDRVGISTGRRLGGAVVRNTVRRRIRAILRASDALVRAPGPVSGGRDLLIVARPASADATFQELQASLVSLLRSIPVSRPDPIP